MKEKYNFRTDILSKTVTIEVSLSIFPPAVILRAAYHFIDEANVIVKDEQEKTVVVLICKKESIKEEELEGLGYEFNVQLVSSFVEEEESKKHVGVRDAMIRAALSSPPPAGSRPPQQQSTGRPPQDNPPGQTNR